MGIRKTLGSIRKQLITQFYTESFLYSSLSFILSLILLWPCSLGLMKLQTKQLQRLALSINFWLVSLGFVCITTLLAGSYPAAYLSSFKAGKKYVKASFSGSKNAAIPLKGDGGASIHHFCCTYSRHDYGE